MAAWMRLCLRNKLLEEQRTGISLSRNSTPRDHILWDNASQSSTPRHNSQSSTSRNGTPLSRTWSTPPISPVDHYQAVDHYQVVHTAVVATESLNTESVEGVVIQDPHREAMKKLEVNWRRMIVVFPVVCIEKKLADTAWSAVYSVCDVALNEKFALMATPMIGALAEAAVAQIGTIMPLKHPNIITFHDTFFSVVAGTKFLCIKMDYCKKGSLREFVENKRAKGREVPAMCVCDLLLQIAAALAYIHEKGVLHGDLRLDNILRTSSGELKLTNFATTSRVPHRTDPALTITGGQQMYAPPEWVTSVYSRQPLHSFEVPEASYDMWGFGCVLSELVTLRLIRGDRVPGNGALASNQAALEGVLRDLDTAQQGAFSAIGRLLFHADPDERMTAPAAVAALEVLPHSSPSPRPFASLRAILSARAGGGPPAPRPPPILVPTSPPSPRPPPSPPSSDHGFTRQYAESLRSSVMEGCQA